MPVLPEQVRRKAAECAAGVMRGLRPNQVPAGLRFAIQWRASAMPRGFADRLLSALADDPEFRERVASVLVDSDPSAQAVVAGTVDPGIDPAYLGAVLYLARPPGWQQRMSSVVVALVDAADTGAALQAVQAEAADLRAKLARAQERYERDLAAARQSEAAVKASSAVTSDRLRSQLAGVKADLALAEAAREEYQREALELARAVRKLRADLGQYKEQAGLTRAAQRDARLATTARAKVLLDVLQGAAAGLAAELALPAGTPSPADLVDAAAPAEPAVSKRLHTAGELSLVLAAPRAHLIVDGYNVSKGVWTQAPLAQQRERLISALTALQARTGAEITVVFDGADVGGVPAVTSRTVRVRFSPPGEPADRVIVRLVDADTSGRPLIVASSDAALTSGARSAGARTVDSQVLAGLLTAGR